MATDFNKPIVTDAYADILPGLVTANKDLARMLEPTLTGTSANVPTGAVRWNAATIRWERYNGTSWVTLPAAGDNVYAISISGNAATASAANNGYFTASSTYPKLEIHKPNVAAGQWAIDSSGNYVFERTNGSGSAIGTLLTLTTSGVLSTPGGYSGNAATATKLATARTIGGVSFDGSANINLPGVNAPGNQNTTGNAATATAAANALGVGQTWRINPGADINTTYTNSVGRSVQVVMFCYLPAGQQLDLVVGGVSISRATNPGTSTIAVEVRGVIKNGDSYIFQGTSPFNTNFRICD